MAAQVGGEKREGNLLASLLSGLAMARNLGGTWTFGNFGGRQKNGWQSSLFRHLLGHWENFVGGKEVMEKSTFVQSGVNLDLRASLAPAASNGSNDTSISGFTPLCRKVGLGEVTEKVTCGFWGPWFWGPGKSWEHELLTDPAYHTIFLEHTENSRTFF